MFSRIASVLVLSIGLVSAEPIIDITKIAGKTPEEVEKVLGPAIDNEMTKYNSKTSFGPKNFYKDETIEVIFTGGKASRISFNPKEDIPVGKELLSKLGLPPTEPTFANENAMRWDDYMGLESIQLNPGKGNLFFAYIIAGEAFKAIQEPVMNSESPEERKKKIDSGFSFRDGSHIELTKLIKKSMNDPKSYDHVDTAFWDMADHVVVRSTFRGKNALGAVGMSWIKAKCDLEGNVVEVMEQGVGLPE